MNIAIVDDEALFRKGLIALMSDIEDIKVVFEAGNGQEFLDELKQASLPPDIVLLDLNMPVFNGIDTAKVLQKEYPYLKVIVLTTHDSKAFITHMVELGVAAYLAKNATPEEVENTIRSVQKNGFFYDQKVLEVIRENMVQKTRPNLHSPFEVNITDREREILQLICEEKTTPEIAQMLFLSTRTVEGHRNNLLTKLDCRNTAGLVATAIRKGLVDIHKMGF